MEERKKEAQKVVLSDNIEGHRPLSRDDSLEKVGAIEEYRKWAVFEETSWR